MGIYNTLLTSECKYNSQCEDNSHPHKQGQRKQTTLSAATEIYSPGTTNWILKLGRRYLAFVYKSKV